MDTAILETRKIIMKGLEIIKNGGEPIQTYPTATVVIYKEKRR